MVPVCLFFIFAEVLMVFAVRFFRKEFQWLITETDECPKLDSKGLEKFFKHGYDPFLGWIRKPNTSGVETGGEHPTKYAINSMGARCSPFTGKAESIIATFGDSYTFCRQVNDSETWQTHLARSLNAGVLNYGVGNYGVDQSLLRYERTPLPSSVRIVVLGFVPETICRIHSYWKHYFEFGNTFAFKPRFMLKNRKLVFFPNIMQFEKDFFRLSEKLPMIRKIDGFYRKRFRRLQFRFPYVLSFLRNPKRNAGLLKSLSNRWLMRKLKKASVEIENAPFRRVMESNIKQAYKMYLRGGPRDLLKAILRRFKGEAVKRGHGFVVMVMPQLIDLRTSEDGWAPYRSFFRELNCEMPVIDLTEFLMGHRFSQLYTNDFYGGHFSKDGNKIMGVHVAEELKKLFPLDLENNAKQKPGA